MYTLNSVEVHAVCYGVDLYNQSITGDKAKCITSKASDADHIPCVCYGLDTYNQNAEEELMPTIRTNGGGDCIPKVAYAVENHPNDSRVKLAEDDIVQTLTSGMGTGGGNVPLVMEKK